MRNAKKLGGRLMDRIDATASHAKDTPEGELDALIDGGVARMRSHPGPSELCFDANILVRANSDASGQLGDS